MVHVSLTRCVLTAMGWSALMEHIQHAPIYTKAISWCGKTITPPFVLILFHFAGGDAIQSCIIARDLVARADIKKERGSMTALLFSCHKEHSSYN